MITKKTYIVSGYMRSGTSMMMKALHAGGLDPVINPKRDHMNKLFGDEDYKPNEGGFYELTSKELTRIGFPKEHEGKLIKVLYGGLPRLCAGNYKIVFMLRDPEEIRQSLAAFTYPHLAPTDVLNYYDELVAVIKGIVSVRRDMDTKFIQYRDVIQGPLSVFQFLKDSGWEVDPEKSAQVIDPTYYRFKREVLVEGI